MSATGAVRRILSGLVNFGDRERGVRRYAFDTETDDEWGESRSCGTSPAALFGLMLCFMTIIGLVNEYMSSSLSSILTKEESSASNSSSTGNEQDQGGTIGEGAANTLAPVPVTTTNAATSNNVNIDIPASATTAAAATGDGDSAITLESAADLYMKAFLLVMWVVVGIATIQTIWRIFKRMRNGNSNNNDTADGLLVTDDTGADNANTFIGNSIVRVANCLCPRLFRRHSYGTDTGVNVDRINAYLARVREMEIFNGEAGADNDVHGTGIDGGGGGDSFSSNLRLALAVMRRGQARGGFLPEDYDLLSQLDRSRGELGGEGLTSQFGVGRGGGRGGLEQGEINRYPVREITQQEVESAKCRAKSRLKAQEQGQEQGQGGKAKRKGGSGSSSRNCSSTSLNQMENGNVHITGDCTSTSPYTDTDADTNSSNNNESNNNPDTDFQCSVCLEQYQVGDRVRTVLCMHNYHMDCIDAWLRDHSACPICKTELA